MPESDLPAVDIAEMNLACAVGLPGSEDLDIPGALDKLDHWAAHIKHETDRHLYRLKDPKWAERYAHSEARFRMEMMVGVCQQDFGVRYHEAQGKNPDYLDSADPFIHGMLGYGEGGICNSVPILYVALGRRLGYPVYVVRAKRHLFVRWEGWGERVNMDASANSGIGFEEDAFYHTWPEPLSKEQLSSGIYLTNLTPARELAHFLYTRALCQLVHFRIADAVEALRPAASLAPGDPLIRRDLDRTERQIEEIQRVTRRYGRMIIHDSFGQPRLDVKWLPETNEYTFTPANAETRRFVREAQVVPLPSR